MKINFGHIPFSKSACTIASIFLSVFLIIGLRIVISIAEHYSVLSFEFMGLIAVSVYLWLFLSYVFQDGRLNIYIIFVIISFPFYFGQHFVLITGGELQYISRSILGDRLPISALNETFIFIIDSMLLLHIGYLFSTIVGNGTSKAPSFAANIEAVLPSQSGLKAVGFVLFCISVIPTGLLLFENIYITINYGYGELFQAEHYKSTGFDNIPRFLSFFFVPSLLMLLIELKGTNKIKYIVLIIFIYISLYLMSGSRLSAVLIMSTLLLIKHLWFAEIKIKQGIKYLLFGIIVLVLLSTISAIRNSVYLSGDLWSIFSEAIADVWKNNPINAAMEEAGFTFIATATVLTYCPSAEPYNLGMSYLNSVFAVFPNLFWDVHPASTNTDVIFKDYITQYGGIGSSFIAEAYYNFGKFALLLMPVFGWFLGVLCKKTQEAVNTQSKTTFYLCMYISSVIIFYVRSDTITFWRNFVYYALIPGFFASLIRSKPGKTVEKAQVVYTLEKKP